MESDRLTAQRRKDAERLADIFTVLQRSFLSRLCHELARGNVSFPQYFLLGYLGHQATLTMSEIARRMGHTTAAATGLVDRLENLGYVKRVHSREDRRKINVNITRSGSALVERVREDMVNNLSKLMQSLTLEEQQMWVRIYEKIIQVWERRD